jgi:hypothetical protein
MISFTALILPLSVMERHLHHPAHLHMACSQTLVSPAQPMDLPLVECPSLTARPCLGGSPHIHFSDFHAGMTCAGILKS